MTEFWGHVPNCKLFKLSSWFADFSVFAKDPSLSLGMTFLFECHAREGGDGNDEAGGDSFSLTANHFG